MKPYNWTRLKHDTEIINAFIVTVKNRFLSLQNSDAEINYPQVEDIHILKRHTK